MALVKTNRSKRQKTLEVIVLNILPHWTSVFLINYCTYGSIWLLSGIRSSFSPVRYPVDYYLVSGKTVSGTSLQKVPFECGAVKQ